MGLQICGDYIYQLISLYFLSLHAKHVTYKGVAGHEQRRGEEVGGRAEGNF